MFRMASAEFQLPENSTLRVVPSSTNRMTISKSTTGARQRLEASA